MSENLKPIQIANKIIKESGIDIFENTDAQKKHKIAVVPSVVVFSDGIEVARFQANIMMVLETTQDEIQDAISEAIMNDF